MAASEKPEESRRNINSKAMAAQSPINIPGISLVPEETVGFTINRIERLNHQTTPKSLLGTSKQKDAINKKLFPGTIISFFDSSNESIHIDAFLLIQTEILQNTPLNENLFNYNCDLIVDYNANYQLNFYLSFDANSFQKDASNLGDEIFELIAVSLEFTNNSLQALVPPLNANQSISMEKIKSLEFFVIETPSTLFENRISSSKVSVQNLPPNSNNNSGQPPFIVSGVEIDTTHSPFVNLVELLPPPDNSNFPFLPVHDGLFAPMVVAFHENANNPLEGSISIKISAFLQNSLDLINNDEFAYFYNVVFDNSIIDTPTSTIKYKLNLYLTFNKPEPTQNITSSTLINTGYFEAVFKRGVEFKPPISSNDTSASSSSFFIPLKDISKVEVFMVNTDPETSRGTVTVVQGG